MERIICLGIGYVCGLLNTGYLVGKMHGIDIREHGSGNAGTTNALRTLGLKAGLMVFAGDVIKCIAAICIARLLYRNSRTDILALLSLYAGAGAILGHNFPFYMKFKGGKGIAATAGIILSFHWIITLCGALTFFTTFFTTHYVSLGSLLVYVGFVIEIIIMGQLGFFGMSQAALLEMYILALALAAMAFYRHRENIKRLLSHSERKTYLTKKPELDVSGKNK